MAPVAPFVEAVSFADDSSTVFGKMGGKTLEFYIPKRNIIKPAFSMDGKYLFIQDLYGNNFFWVVEHLWI